jgi:hypothetical protein
MQIRRLTALMAVVGIVCLLIPTTQAQTATTGQIVGVVTDPSGAVVVGEKVALTSDAGVRREILPYALPGDLQSTRQWKAFFPASSATALHIHNSHQEHYTLRPLCPLKREFCSRCVRKASGIRGISRAEPLAS